MRTTIRKGFTTIAAGMVFAALATACFSAEDPASAARAPAAPAPPNPVLVLTGLEYYEAGDKEFTRYKYRVDNFTAYPNELFAPSPDLPPCGKNANSARTWVDFYDESGKRLYGFCALGNHDHLNMLWFAVQTGSAPPDRVYIEINDRKTNTRYKSNLAPTSRDPRLK